MALEKRPSGICAFSPISILLGTRACGESCRDWGERAWSGRGSVKKKKKKKEVGWMAARFISTDTDAEADTLEYKRQAASVLFGQLHVARSSENAGRTGPDWRNSESHGELRTTFLPRVIWVSRETLFCAQRSLCHLSRRSLGLAKSLLATKTSASGERTLPYIA